MIPHPDGPRSRTAAQLAKIESTSHRLARRARGRLPDGARPCRGLANGLFHEPTILDPTWPTISAPRRQEEIFRLRLSVIPFADEEEAVALAKRSHTGLPAGVWTPISGAPTGVARTESAGQCRAWGQPLPGRDLQLALRRLQASGIGRVKRDRDALDEFLQTHRGGLGIELDEEIQDPFVLKAVAARTTGASLRGGDSFSLSR